VRRRRYGGDERKKKMMRDIKMRKKARERQARVVRQQNSIIRYMPRNTQQPPATK